MRKILKIAQREFVETVKTKMFLIGVLLMPIMMIGMIFISSKMNANVGKAARPAQKVAITDLTGVLGEELSKAFERHNKSNSGKQYTLQESPVAEGDLKAHEEKMQAKVRNGSLSAYIVITKEAFEGKEVGRLYRKTRNISDLESGGMLQRLINESATNRRILDNGISPNLFSQLRQPVSLNHIELGSKKGAKGNPMGAIMVPFFFMFLMFMGVFGMSQQILSSVIEEKSSRVMEVVLAVVSPMELLAGKILGAAAVGLGLVAIWGAGAYSVAVYRGMGDIVSLSILIWFCIYFIMGFLLFASILAAIGSACNTAKEAQGFVGPLSMIIVVPMLCWLQVAQNPEGVLATVLSLIPPMTPLIMILRLSAQPDLPWIHIAGSLLALGLSVPLMIFISARVFRTGVLMYGKPPSLREILRWARK